MDSDYLQLTLKNVVEHIHGIVLSHGSRALQAGEALDLILTLVNKESFPSTDGAWVDELLASAVRGGMQDEIFARFLRFRGMGAGRLDVPLIGTVASEFLTPDDTIFKAISGAIKISSEGESGWQDRAVYGGLSAIRDIPRLGFYLPDHDFLEMLYGAMGDSNNSNVRKAAYGVVWAARDGWLTSPHLRRILLDRDFPRQLYGVVDVAPGSDHRRTFLDMMEILSRDEAWRSYLRREAGMWLPWRSDGWSQVICILENISKITFPKIEPAEDMDMLLIKVVRDEWARVPGRGAKDLTADVLAPFAEVTVRLNHSLFDEDGRRAVLTVVEQVIPSLERWRSENHEELEEGVNRIVRALLEDLRML